MQPGFIAAMKSECGMLSKPPLPGKAKRLENGALLVLSGIGRDRAVAAAEILMKGGATVLISWGVATGLVREATPGTLILPERIVSRHQNSFSADASIYEQICKSLDGRIPHLRGTLAESTRVLKNSGEKKALLQKTGAVAADMESAAIAETAKTAGLPFFVVRVVLDRCTNAMPSCALAAIDEYGSVRFSRFVRNLSPREIPGLAVLALSQWKARATLRRVGRVILDLKF